MYKAVLRGVRLSPLKGRVVADLVRGKSLERVMYELKYTPTKAAKIIDKLVRSAMSNAEANFQADIDNLFLGTIVVDEGPRYKRFQARAKGRSNQIVKRTSHITVILEEKSK